MLIEPAYDGDPFGKSHDFPPIPEREITLRLGVFPDRTESADGKVTRMWKIRINGQFAAIWDFRDLRWSAFDPHEVLPTVFGFKYERKAS